VRWDVAGPERVLEARTHAARDAMRRIMPEDAGAARASALLRRIVDACRPEGRPLAAAHASLPWPDDDATALWHAATVLREHRGDGHNAVLVAHGVSPAEALVLDGAYNTLKTEKYFAFRRFREDELQSARDALRARAFLSEDGTITDGGGKFREMIEMETDRLATPPYSALTEAEREELGELLTPIAESMAEQRGVPRFVGALSGNRNV
jgi:hypothetical protein